MMCLFSAKIEPKFDTSTQPLVFLLNDRVLPSYPLTDFRKMSLVLSPCDGPFPSSIVPVCSIWLPRPFLVLIFFSMETESGQISRHFFKGMVRKSSPAISTELRIRAFSLLTMTRYGSSIRLLFRILQVQTCFLNFSFELTLLLEAGVLIKQMPHYPVPIPGTMAPFLLTLKTGLEKNVCPRPPSIPRETSFNWLSALGLSTDLPLLCLDGNPSLCVA